MQKKVQEFHERFGVTINTKPTLVDDKILALRDSLIKEEAQEFSDAVAFRDIVAMTDALADLAYVVFGAAVTLGIDLEPVFNEVHRSNMSKAEPDGTVLRREDGKIIKSKFYSPADVRGELIKQGWECAREN